MALHVTRAAAELLQFRLRDTNELVQVEVQYVKWMAKLVKAGERNAISQRDALKAMGVTDTDSHRRQWRAAADYWQEQGVFVGATAKGYFLVSTEEERKKCLEHKQKAIEANTRRMSRQVSLPLTSAFPIDLTND